VVKKKLRHQKFQQKVVTKKSEDDEVFEFEEKEISEDKKLMT
jgi:hypothetical protein